MPTLDKDEKIQKITRKIASQLGNTYMMPVITLTSIVFYLGYTDDVMVKHSKGSNIACLIVNDRSNERYNIDWKMIDKDGSELSLYDQEYSTIDRLYKHIV